MKKLTTLLIALFTITSLSALQPSEYCNRLSGHLNDPNFGDANSHMILTITRESENSIAVIVKPRSASSAQIDYLQVDVMGFAPIIINREEDTPLSEYKAVITYTGTPPAEVQILNILWSNPKWGGRWAINNITVPFDAACDIEYNDDVKPVMTKATLSQANHTSLQLELAATDVDNNQQKTVVNTFILNDAANNIVNKVVKTDAAGKVELTALKAGTTYNIQVKAKDEAGNISDNSLTVAASTQSLPSVYVIDNFEGETKAWEPAEGGHTPQVVANPQPTGINTSAKVLQGGRDAGSNNWAATIIRNLNLPGGLYNYLHVMMYRNVIATVPNAKMSDVIGGDIAPYNNQTMTAGVWQDVVFDISAINAAHTLDFLYFMYDRGNLTENAIVYLDDIILSNDATPRTSNTTGSVQTDRASSIKIVATNNQLHILNALGEMISVYRIDGIQVVKQRIESDNHTINLEQGIYMVRVGNVSKKVMIP